MKYKTLTNTFILSLMLAGSAAVAMEGDELPDQSTVAAHQTLTPENKDAENLLNSMHFLKENTDNPEGAKLVANLQDAINSEDKDQVLTALQVLKEQSSAEEGSGYLAAISNLWSYFTWGGSTPQKVEKPINAEVGPVIVTPEAEQPESDTATPSADLVQPSVDEETVASGTTGDSYVGGSWNPLNWFGNAAGDTSEVAELDDSILERPVITVPPLTDGK